MRRAKLVIGVPPPPLNIQSNEAGLYLAWVRSPKLKGNSGGEKSEWIIRNIELRLTEPWEWRSIDTHRFSSGNWRLRPAHRGGVAGLLHFVMLAGIKFYSSARYMLHLHRMARTLTGDFGSARFSFVRQKNRQQKKHLHGCWGRCHYRLGTRRNSGLLESPGDWRTS